MVSVGPWLLEDGVLHLNHGSFGATPAPVLEAQERIRQRFEANPTKYFVGGEYQQRTGRRPPGGGRLRGGR